MKSAEFWEIVRAGVAYKAAHTVETLGGISQMATAVEKIKELETRHVDDRSLSDINPTIRGLFVHDELNNRLLSGE
jgi:hypothetical protein